MDRSQIEAIVLESIENTNQAREDDEQIDASPTAPLFGGDGPLDSMALVALVIDIEEALADEGVEVRLTDEKAMSQSRSPFRDVPSLVAFIEQTMAAQSA